MAKDRSFASATNNPSFQLIPVELLTACLQPAEVGAIITAAIQALADRDRPFFDSAPSFIGRPVFPAHRRPDIPVAVRREVYAADGYRCVKCGAGQDLSIDHRIPRALGGSDDRENLQTMCRPCNRRKGVSLDA